MKQSLVILALAILGFVGCGGEKTETSQADFNKVYEVKFDHVVSVNKPKGKAADFF